MLKSISLNQVTAKITAFDGGRRYLFVQEQTAQCAPRIVNGQVTIPNDLQWRTVKGKTVSFEANENLKENIEQLVCSLLLVYAEEFPGKSLPDSVVPEKLKAKPATTTAQPATK